MDISTKPFAQSCENNKHAIADGIEPYIRPLSSVLEIGSGTGQHAVYFGQRFPHLLWQTSDLHENHAGINTWLAEYSGDNVLAPIELDIEAPRWAINTYDAVFTANVIHIIDNRIIGRLFEHFVEVLNQDGLLFMYGPFNYDGRYTSEGNKRLDDWLKSLNPQFGIQDFSVVDSLAREQGLTLLDDSTMPANNRLLIWRRFG